MPKYKLYAIIAARLIIITIGFLLLFPFWLLYVLSLIAETYLTSLFSFVTSTQNLLTRLNNKTVANERS